VGFKVLSLDYSRVEVAADAEKSEKTGKAGKTETSEKPGKDMLIY